MKIRHKITLLFAFLVTAILLLVSFSVYYFTELDRKEVFSKRLQSRASYNAQIFSLIGDSSTALLDRINTSSSGLLPQKSVGIYNIQGQSLYRFDADTMASIVLSQEIINETLANGESFFRIGEREALAYFYPEKEKPRIIAVAAYDEDGSIRLKQLRQIFLISLLIGILLSLFVGYIFSSQLLFPLAQIIREVNDISSQNLSTRINAGKSQDEMNQLANTFNDLLNRLHESFTTQRRFISNASHELSTPLTSISSQLQVTLQRERSVEEYRQVMQSVQEDVQQMLQLTKSLLEIAKTGSQGSIELNEVRIDEVLFKVMADIRKISSSYKVELNFGDLPDDDNSFLVFGNSDLLYISIKNIVENGCKFSVDHTSLVDLSFHNKEIIIEVRNKGDVIADNETEHIFQPFYRSPSSSKIPGFGLGLALARRIAGLHKGSIQVVSDKETGTAFTIRLPELKYFG